MKIISKFKDYYDSVSQSGVDETILYIREDQEFIDNKDLKQTKHWLGFHYPIPSFRELSKDGKDIDFYIIGFCGEWYLLSIKDNVLYINEDILVLFKKLLSQFDYNRFFEWYQLIKNTDQELFFKYKSPILVFKWLWFHRYFNLTINDKLKDIQFYKIKDSWTSFQQIQNYISGVLGTLQDNDYKLTDKDKIIQHGMDLKWSFRNPNPPKRKQK